MICIFTCEQCGRPARKRRSPANTPKAPRFCSQRCHGLAKRGSGAGPAVTHTFTCAACGTESQAHRSPSAAAPKYCSLRCTGAAQRGEGNPSWTGGRHKDSAGYVLICMPDHPGADVRGYVLEHRLVAERKIGRSLTGDEVVHHINRIKDDNRPENLEVLPNHAEHAKLHQAERVR